MNLSENKDSLESDADTKGIEERLLWKGIDDIVSSLNKESGGVIGKSGSVIKNLQQSMGAKIRIEEYIDEVGERHRSRAKGKRTI